jgi:excisionase family DNA binding protein
VTFTVTELAAKWRCNPASIYRLVDRGQLAAFRIGRHIRIPQSAVEAFAGGSPVTPAEQQAALLGEDTLAWIRELVAAAGPLSEAQRDAIRAAFRTGGAQR